MRRLQRATTLAADAVTQSAANDLQRTDELALETRPAWPPTTVVATRGRRVDWPRRSTALDRRCPGGRVVRRRDDADDGRSVRDVTGVRDRARHRRRFWCATAGEQEHCCAREYLKPWSHPCSLPCAAASCRPQRILRSGRYQRLRRFRRSSGWFRIGRRRPLQSLRAGRFFPGSVIASADSAAARAAGGSSMLRA